MVVVSGIPKLVIHWIQISLVVLLIVLPIISLFLCEVNVNLSISNIQCKPDLYGLKLISSRFYSLLFLSAFTLFIPLIIYIVIVFLLIYFIGYVFNHFFDT